MATGVPLLLIGVGLALMAVARKRSSYSKIEDNEVSSAQAPAGAKMILFVEG